jgi:hypothetical protein
VKACPTANRPLAGYVYVTLAQRRVYEGELPLPSLAVYTLHRQSQST